MDDKTLLEMAAKAAGKGKVSENPVDALRVKSASVKRERLTLDVFLKIYAAAAAMPDRWIANMMRLAIVTAQPLQVWLGGDVVRRVSFRPSVDYASLFFDDCQHPAQNAYCDPKSIMAWRYVDTTHPKD